MDYNHSKQTTKLTPIEPRISISSVKKKSISSVKLKVNHDKRKSRFRKEQQKDSTISDEIIKTEKDSQEPISINFPIYKELSSSEQDYIHAKSYLMTASSLTNISVYDHLVELLKKLLREKPINAVDILENISQTIKSQHISIKGDYTELPTQVLKIAQFYSDLLMKIKIEGENADDNEELEIKKSLRKIDDSGIVNNFKPYLSFIQAYGFELSQEEYYHIYSSLILLAKTRPIENVRFWGKIHGMIKDYIIFEADLKNNAELNEMKDLMFEMDDQETPNIRYPLDYKGPRDKLENLDPVQGLLLEPKIKTSVYIPAEDIGKGANKNIYFVCNQLGESWILLPKVTPDQISIARMIKKPFTGIYAAPVISYPPFPGKEINLLRAQIALISADTLVSPKGYYEISKEEIDNNGVSYSLNKVENFQISVETLLNPDLSSWVHHSYHILPQGRCTWVKPQKKSENSSEVGIDNDKEEEIEQQVKEEKSVEEGLDEVDVQEVESLTEYVENEVSVGPSLLSPLSLDKVINGVHPWSLISSSNLMPQYSICILKSNIWPGSYTICDGINLENVYIGFGVKQSENPYSPQLPPFPENQYSSQKIKDLSDPLPEDDKEYQEILQILKLREERRIQLKEERQLKIEKIKEQRRIQKELQIYEDESENFESLEGSVIQTEEKIEENVRKNNEYSSPKIISSEMETGESTTGTKYELERKKESIKPVLEYVESDKITSAHQRKESKTIEIIDSLFERQQKKESETIEIIDSSLERQQASVSSKTEIPKPKDLFKEQYSNKEQLISTSDENFKPTKSSKIINHLTSVSPKTSKVEIPKSKSEFKIAEKGKQLNSVETSLLSSQPSSKKSPDLKTEKHQDVNKQNIPKLKSQSFEVETFETVSNLRDEEDTNIESLSKSSIEGINKSPGSVKSTTDTKMPIVTIQSTSDFQSSQKSSIKVPLNKKPSQDSIASQKSNKLTHLLSDYESKEERKKSKTYEKLKQKNIERKTNF